MVKCAVWGGTDGAGEVVWMCIAVPSCSGDGAVP
jgi:hypothetical protein